MAGKKAENESKKEREAHVPRPGAKVYPIVKYPAAVLAQVGEKVTEFGPELATLVEDMFDSMYVAQGIGLAAPQIGIGKRITVIDVGFKEKPEDRLVLINPEILESKGRDTSEEGCLSLPDIREKVQRPAWVKVRAQKVSGEFFEVEGDDLFGRAMQHEIDHLNGVLFIDRLSRLKRDLVLRKIKKLQKNGDW
jgi:peptide deformylase